MANGPSLFVARYVGDGDLRNIFTRNMPRSQSRATDLRDSLDAARAAYSAYDYVETLELLDWIILSQTGAVLKDAIGGKLRGAALQRAIDYREALLLFEKVTSWLGFNGLISSGRQFRGVEILSDIDFMTSLIEDDFSTESARVFRLRAAGSPAVAEEVLARALANSRSPRNLVALNDAAGALAMYLEDYRTAAKAYGVALDLGSREMSSESLALAEGFRAIAEFRATPPSERSIGAVIGALNACEREGHLGFAGQLRTRLARIYYDLGEPDTALSFVRSYPNHTVGISGPKVPKTEYRRQFLEAAAATGAPAQRIEFLRSRLPAIDSALAADGLFGEVGEQFLRALLDRNSVVGAALLGPIVEYAVAQMARRLKVAQQSNADAWTPLAKRILVLFEEGHITYHDADLLTRVRVTLRNPFSHGSLDSVSLREYRDPLELFCVYSHTCSLWHLVASAGSPNSPSS